MTHHKLLQAPWLQAWAVLLVGVLSFLDNRTGVELSFSIFYLIPVAAVSWWGGSGHALVVSVLSAVAWLAADAPARDFTHPWIPIWNAFVRLGFFVVVAASLRQVAASLKREQDLARTDMLTGLYNARWFYDFLATELERMRRTGRCTTLAYIDLDNFKAVNDALGHPVGNRVLRTVAAGLSSSLRRADVISRLGGDEFVVLLPETTEKEARHVLERTITSLRAGLKRARWPVTLSVGVVTYARAPDSVEQIVKHADDLMYRAKRSGKNRMLFESSDSG